MLFETKAKIAQLAGVVVYTNYASAERYIPTFTMSVLDMTLNNLMVRPQSWIAQSAGAIEYTDCTSAKG